MSDDKLKEQIFEFEKIYSEMLSDERWQESPFLKVMHAKLMKLKNQLSDYIDLVYSEEKPILNGHIEKHPETNDLQKIFIYLYTSDGKKIDSWQRLIANLDKQYISRPIYQDEVHAQHAVFHAPIFSNAGYVAVWVEKKFINSFSIDEMQKDKFGHPLVSLKDRAIQLEKIDYFWNNYAAYHQSNGKLIFSKHLERLQK